MSYDTQYSKQNILNRVFGTDDNSLRVIEPSHLGAVSGNDTALTEQNILNRSYDEANQSLNILFTNLYS